VVLAVDWTSSLAFLAYVPSLLFLATLAFAPSALILPPEPLIELGHPQVELGDLRERLGSRDGTSKRTSEELRLASLKLSDLIENKGATPIRSLTTGVRRDSTEYQFQDWLAQILESGQPAPVDGVTIPKELHEGMTEQNRAESFTLWVCFTRGQAPQVGGRV
jgi:hypothetical protein